MYDDNTVYIVGHGRTTEDNAITDQYNIFFITLIVNLENDNIIDLGVSCTVNITEKFIKSILIDKKLSSNDIKEIEEEVEKRYFGSSRRAIIVAYKDALKKYKNVKEKYY